MDVRGREKPREKERCEAARAGVRKRLGKWGEGGREGAAPRYLLPAHLLGWGQEGAP